MSDFLNALRAGPLLADGGVGSYLFERTGRLSESNHVYEALNVEDPDVVTEVHLRYLEAGAQCITTNTFGANRATLEPLGAAARVEELNRAGARLVRRAIETFEAGGGAPGPHFVLGSVGPTPSSSETLDEARSIYREQVEALVAEAPDALVLETFASLDHAEVVCRLARDVPNPPPVVAHLSLRQGDAPAGWDRDPAEAVARLAAAGAQVVGVNCLAPWEAAALLDAVAEVEAVARGEVLLSVMPNAGGFQRIGHRYMTRVNPEYMGRLARTLAQRGVRLIGGCCEVHPPHIAEMGLYLRAGAVGRRVATVSALPGALPAGADAKRANGLFSRKLADGEFVVSVEVVPPRGTASATLASKIDAIGAFAASGAADAVDVTDGSRGIPLMPPADFIASVRERLGWDRTGCDPVEFIPHFTSRDLNAMGLQSRLVGYHARRIHNVLLITGDPPKMSPGYPRSTAVFDLDSVALIRLIHSCLNAGLDFGGRPLGKDADSSPHFTIGTGFEPEALDLEHELEKLRRKVDAGADYVMTQPAFRLESLNVLEPFRARVPILVGVMVATSVEHARRLAQIPGVVVPRAIFERLEAWSRVEDQSRAGFEIAVEQAAWVREQGWAGLYLMSPSSLQAAVDLLRQSVAGAGAG